MGPGSYLFQIYRTRDGACAWRLVSPNGRALGCSVGSFAAPGEARADVTTAVEQIERMDAVLRTMADHRWLWTLNLDGAAVVRGATTQDRHVRCVMAWHRFVLAAPLGTIAPEVLHFPTSGTRRPTGPRQVAPL